MTPNKDISIVCFDDAPGIEERLCKGLREQERESVQVHQFTTPYLEPAMIEEIAGYRPNLITTGLDMGDLMNYSRKFDAYRLIRKLHEDPQLSGVPIVVISALIGDDQFGIIEKERVLGFPGVVAACEKYPMPTIAELRQYARPYHA